jgi:hypothetical protein
LNFAYKNSSRHQIWRWILRSKKWPTPAGGYTGELVKRDKKACRCVKDQRLMDGCCRHSTLDLTHLGDQSIPQFGTLANRLRETITPCYHAIYSINTKQLYFGAEYLVRERAKRNDGWV